MEHKIDYILDQKTILNKLQGTCTIKIVFSDGSVIYLAMSNNNNNNRVNKNLYAWKLRITSKPRSQRKENHVEIRAYLELKIMKILQIKVVASP